MSEPYRITQCYLPCSASECTLPDITKVNVVNTGGYNVFAFSVCLSVYMMTHNAAAPACVTSL